MKDPAVIIGSGVDELVAAHTLARAGYRVIVLAEHPEHDALNSGWVPPRIVRALELDRHGLRIGTPDPWATAPLPEGGRLELWRDPARSVEAIRKVSPGDAAKWPEFCGRMANLRRLLETLYCAPPPEPLSREAGAWVRLAGAALEVRGLGRRGMEDLLRLMPMPVADWLDDWFENDALKGMLGAAGIMHLCQGPRSGGTAYRLLHHHAGSPPGVFRPPRSNVRSVLSAIPGIEIRSGVGLARIAVRGERVAGVVLADGVEIDSSLVVSGADPRRTLMELVEPGWLDPELLRAVATIRARGVVARVDLTLNREPGFSTLVVAPSLDYLERAYDHAKYRRVSEQPYIEAHHDGGGADGRHRVSLHVQYAPYALAEGTWDDARATALERSAVGLLSRHVPGLDAAIEERSIHTPHDFERACGYPEGQCHHAELALDQAFWMRPLPGWANYRTPIGGLYLCGAATHPGAGVAGASGANAAREIIRDAKRGGFNDE